MRCRSQGIGGISYGRTEGRVQNKPRTLGEFRQTRPRQPAAKKHGTASAGMMRQYGTRPEKTRKSLLAVARLQAVRCSRASLRANPQTPGNPPASAAPRRDVYGVVGCRDMQAASKHGFWARTSLHGSGMAITPWQPAPDMVARHVEEEVARNRAGAVFSQPSG